MSAGIVLMDTQIYTNICHSNACFIILDCAGVTAHGSFSVYLDLIALIDMNLINLLDVMKMIIE